MSYTWGLLIRIFRLLRMPPTPGRSHSLCILFHCGRGRVLGRQRSARGGQVLSKPRQT